jgi:oligoendopeptidase F
MIGGMTLAGKIISMQAVTSGMAQRGSEAYLTLLSSGPSKSPLELLEDARVDMTMLKPFDAAMREMYRAMDEIERIHAAGKS